MIGEQIFNYKYNPFHFHCFAIEMPRGIEQIPIKTIFLVLAIKPVQITISTNTDYNISLEFKIWKFSTSLSFRFWNE